MSNNYIPTTKNITREPRSFIRRNREYIEKSFQPISFDKCRLALLDQLENSLDKLEILRNECLELENSGDTDKTELAEKIALLNNNWRNFCQERAKASKNLPFSTAPLSLRELFQEFLRKYLFLADS